MKTKTLLTKPLLQITENFLTTDECQSLINTAKSNLKNSSIIDEETGCSRVSQYRTSDSYDLSLDHELTISIYDKISNILNIDKDRFEDIQIIKYKKDDLFDVHVDYFMSTTDDKYIKKGGQRVGTVILYLNNVENGGETFFPLLRIIEQPKTGKMIYFKYDYSDEINFKTSHKGMSVIDDEKWIATVWIRESSRTQCPDNLILPDKTIINDVEYDLECDTIDTKTLSIKLFGNVIAGNTIMIKITPTSESMLLLYLLTSLNFHQNNPYFILPFINDEYSDKQIDLINNMINNVRDRTKSDMILDCEKYDKLLSINEIFNKKTCDRFYKYSYIYVSDIDNLSENDNEFLIVPFKNLQSSHINYAIDQMNIAKLLQ